MDEASDFPSLRKKRRGVQNHDRSLPSSVQKWNQMAKTGSGELEREPATVVSNALKDFSSFYLQKCVYMKNQNNHYILIAYSLHLYVSMTIEFRYRRIKFLNDGFAMPIFPLDKQAVVKNSCSDCAAYRVCAFKGGTAPVCSVLDSMIEEELYLEKGSVVCNSSQPARDLYAVRSGALKECTIDRAGKERVIEFYFPGETVGLYALSQHTYRYC